MTISLKGGSNNKRITQAFILGAGLGTRLRPLTDTMPKVMVPIAPRKPVLEHQIEWLKKYGITEFIINIHYLPDVITSYFGNGERWGVNIIYSDERGDLLETAGAIKKAESYLHENFIFMYGDEVTFLDLAPAIGLYSKTDALAVIVTKTSDVPHDGDLAEFNPETGKISRWHTRPHNIKEFTPGLALNAGIYVMNKRIAEYIPAGVPIKLDGEIIPRALAARESLYAYHTDEPVLDIGRPEKYAAAKEYYRKKIEEEAL